MPRVRNALLALIFTVATCPARAQSEAVSQVSALSVAPSAIAAGAGLSLIVGVGELTVLSIERTGELVVATVRAGSEAAAFTIELSAEAVHALGIAVGTTLEASVVAGGWLIACAGEALAFVPDATTAALIHHRMLP